jgi:hypothetical protein
VCWKKLLGAEREANVGGAKAGSVGIKRGSSEMYLVFSVWWFFFLIPTTLYIATIIVAA